MKDKLELMLEGLAEMIQAEGQTDRAALSAHVPEIPPELIDQMLRVLEQRKKIRLEGDQVTWLGDDDS